VQASKFMRTMAVQIANVCSRTSTLMLSAPRAKATAPRRLPQPRPSRPRGGVGCHRRWVCFTQPFKEADQPQPVSGGKQGHCRRRRRQSKLVLGSMCVTRTQLRRSDAASTVRNLAGEYSKHGTLATGRAYPLPRSTLGWVYQLQGAARPTAE